MSDIQAFVHRSFQPPKAEHKNLDAHRHDEQDWNDEKYDWEYFGQQKYGRYAVCKNTNIKRGLTMGEFYGAGVVD